MAVLRQTAGAEGEKLDSRQWVWRTLRPGGCVLVLALMALALVVCFTHRGDPVADYVPQRDGAYYAAHLPELVQELETGLLPYLPECQLAVEADRVTVRAKAEDLPRLRELLLAHFDEALFRFAAASG